MNSRLDEMQAAILRVKLPHLDAGNARRRRDRGGVRRCTVQPDHARRAAARRSEPRVPPICDAGGRPRRSSGPRCAKQGVGTGVHYAVPVHLQPAYLHRTSLGPARCKASETAGDEVLSLPMYPELTDDEVQTVCNAVRAL